MSKRDEFLQRLAETHRRNVADAYRRIEECGKERFDDTRVCTLYNRRFDTTLTLESTDSQLLQYARSPQHVKTLEQYIDLVEYLEMGGGN